MQSSIVMIHVLRMSKVPRVLQLGCQWTMSVPLPNKSELILCSVVLRMMRRRQCKYIEYPDCRGRGHFEICSSGTSQS